ncbi:MAG: protein-L-isoaspartate(D-aspartate) O-methyltransferase, partial [Thermoplasmata archaeon]|nr:protein-L-isoaspartate(D-aspartate) O-methyltransferase [Thermoplasmata archaeon]
LLRTPRVIDAFRSVDRAHFCPGPYPYVDSPQPIGHGQTISAPHMVAIMSEAARVDEGTSVLEVGGGSGYQAAILGALAAPSTVHTVEYVPGLAEVARSNLARAGVANVVVHFGDGSLGLPEHAPFDRIVVTCAAPAVPPPLLEQLADGGCLLVPVGKGFQDLIRVSRDGGRTRSEDLGGCVFVPLRGEHGFR